MKSTLGKAAIVAVASYLETVSALEHPLLTSTADFKETWIEKPTKSMVEDLKERSQTVYFDATKRPVIGVLTEPLRGDLYQASSQTNKLNSEEELVPGYVPRSHVQFLEQAGVRVVPIDYRLSRDELVDVFG